jgi:pyruvate/2-oxoglutarate dehydrogenase complex dihydrolipoamide dehydrogenase (E3) component
MAQAERYDALVLGSGQGGQLMAWHLARSGQRAAVVERRWVAGSCPMIACMPSKNEIWGARVAHLAQHGAHYGVTTGPVGIDMARVCERRRAMVDEEEAIHRGFFKESGAELIEGSGRFVAPKTLEVTLNAGGTRVLAGERVFLNLGTHAAIPNVPGLADARPMTHIELLELDRLPAHLIILGGGYIGLEFAQAYRRFGSHITVIDPGAHIMGHEDSDVVEEMQRLLAEEGVEIVTSAAVLSVQGRSGEQVALTIRTENGDKTIAGSDILVATGRVPNTTGIGLDTTGVELDARGYIRVNHRLETSAPDVWAIGESAGSPHFTHISIDDFRIISANLAGGDRSTRDRLVPYCLFTDPPLARVGLSETEARQRGVAVRVAKMPMAGVLRAHTTDERRGFAKMLVGHDDRILGFTMFGAEAGEVTTVVQTAMLANLPYQALRDMPIAHLTMAEALIFLLLNVPAG